MDGFWRNSVWAARIAMPTCPRCPFFDCACAVRVIAGKARINAHFCNFLPPLTFYKVEPWNTTYPALNFGPLVKFSYIFAKDTYALNWQKTDGAFAHEVLKNALFCKFLPSLCILESWNINCIIYSIRSWSSGEIFTHIGPSMCPKMMKNRSRRAFKDDCVLETSVAALNTFSKMTVSLKQAQRHSTLLQRWQGSLKQAQWYSAVLWRWLGPWNKCSSTGRFFKDDWILGTSEEALNTFSKMTGSLELAKQHSALLWR